MPRWPSPSHAPPDVRRVDRVLPDRLPADAGPVLTRLARTAIAVELGVAATPPDPPGWARAPGCSFVTLTTLRGELRGCIGSTSPARSLSDDVCSNARGAAFRDPRFPPLAATELPRTRVEVSVLSAPVPFPVVDEADALARLRPGVDGVVLEYAGRRATFLPQVWDKLTTPEQFLAGLKRKRGLPPTFWADDLRLSRYVVTAFHEDIPEPPPEELLT